MREPVTWDCKIEFRGYDSDGERVAYWGVTRQAVDCTPEALQDLFLKNLRLSEEAHD